MPTASGTASPEPLDQGREATLVALGRGDAAQYATLQDGLSYFDTSFGYIAYKSVHGIDVTLGGPICTLADEPELVRRFLAQTRRPLFFYLRSASLPAIAESGLSCAAIGVDRSAELKKLRASPPRDVQGALRHAQRDGIRWVEHPRTELGNVQLETIQAVDAAYLAHAPCSTELQFLHRPVRPQTDRGRRFLILERTDQTTGTAEPFGYATLSPVHRDGAVVAWLLDALRFRPTRTRGLWLSTVHHLAGHLADEGCGLHLGFDPLHRLFHPRTLRGHLLRAQLDGFASLIGPESNLARLRRLKQIIPGLYDPRFVASYTRLAPVAVRAMAGAMGVGTRQLLQSTLLARRRPSRRVERDAPPV